MSDWKPLTDAELEDYETRDSREEFLKASLIDARAVVADTPMRRKTLRFLLEDVTADIVNAESPEAESAALERAVSDVMAWIGGGDTQPRQEKV